MRITEETAKRFERLQVAHKEFEEACHELSLLEREERASRASNYGRHVVMHASSFSRSREYRSPSRRSSSGSGGGDSGDDSGGSDPEPPAVTLCFKESPPSSFSFPVKQTHSTGQGPRFEGRWL